MGSEDAGAVVCDSATGITVLSSKANPPTKQFALDAVFAAKCAGTLVICVTHAFDSLFAAAYRIAQCSRPLFCLWCCFFHAPPTPPPPPSSPPPPLPPTPFAYNAAAAASAHMLTTRDPFCVLSFCHY